MQKPELISGIKNAISRGYSLEQAKRSFINAGYNIIDVEDSSRAFSGIISSIPNQLKPIASLPLLPTIPAKPLIWPPIQPQQSSPQILQPRTLIQQKPKNIVGIIIIVVLGIILLLLIAGLIGMLVSKESTINFLEKILPFLKLDSA